MGNLGNKKVMAKNLHYYLERSGKSQKELAEIVGVATSTFNDWMKAKAYPRIDKIELLAMYFGILKSDLIEDKGDNNTNPLEKPRLTEGEEELLNLFRQIPESKQTVVLEMIRLALKTQE